MAQPGGAPLAGLPLEATFGRLHQHLGPSGRRQAQGAQDGLRLPGRRRRRRDNHPTKQRCVLAARAPLQDPRGTLPAARYVHQSDGPRRPDPVLHVTDRGIQDVPRGRRGGRRASRRVTRRHVFALHHGHSRARRGGHRLAHTPPEALPAVRLEGQELSAGYAGAGAGERLPRPGAHRGPHVVRQPRTRFTKRIHSPAKLHAPADVRGTETTDVDVGFLVKARVRLRRGGPRRGGTGTAGAGGSQRGD